MIDNFDEAIEYTKNLKPGSSFGTEFEEFGCTIEVKATKKKTDIKYFYEAIADYDYQIKNLTEQKMAFIKVNQPIMDELEKY